MSTVSDPSFNLRRYNVNNMPDPYNSSFIPKNNPTKGKRVAVGRQVYLFTLVSYVILFATLIATAGIYFYEKYINDQLATEVTLLGQEVSNFNMADMQRVVDFDRRLKQAQGRLENMASPVALFDTLEKVVVSDVQIDSLTISRDGDNALILKAEMITDSFDSTITQRKEYSKNEIIGSVNITNIVPNDLDSSADYQSGQDEEAVPEVKFNVDLNVPISSVLYSPNADYESDFISRLNKINTESNTTDLDTETVLSGEELINNEDI